MSDPEGAGRPRPSAAWYVLGAGALFAGLAVAITIVIVAVLGIFTAIDDYQRVDIPGSATIQVDEPGEQIIFVEDTRELGAFLGGGPAVEVYDPDGDLLQLGGSWATQSYTHDGYHGTETNRFTAAEPGPYRVEVASAEALPATARLAIGPSAFDGIPGRIVLAVLAGLGGLVVGLVVVVVTAVRRGRDKRRLEAA